MDQARRAMYGMLNKSSKLCLPLDLKLKLFDQLVIPVLLYGCEIWGFEDLRQLEAFHIKFCKYILMLSKNIPNCMVYGEPYLGVTNYLKQLK